MQGRRKKDATKPGCRAQFWTTTRDTRLAAALGSMGVMIKLETSADALSGHRRTLFFLGTKSMDGRHDTKLLIARFQSGFLEQNEPGCELLTNLRGMMNRDMILDLQHKGEFMELRPVGKTGVWQYVRGRSGLPGVSGHRAVVETRDIKIAAGLGLVGIPLLAIRGTRGNFIYDFPELGPVRADGSRYETLKLRDAWRTNRESMDPACPYTQGMYALDSRERLVNALNGGVTNILLRKKGTLRSAVVREDASDEAFERAGEFLAD